MIYSFSLSGIVLESVFGTPQVQFFQLTPFSFPPSDLRPPKDFGPQAERGKKVGQCFLITAKETRLHSWC